MAVRTTPGQSALARHAVDGALDAQRSRQGDDGALVAP